MDQQRKIKIGVLCNEMTFPKWRADILEHLHARNEFEVAVFIINSKPPSILAKIKRTPVRDLFFHSINKLEAVISSRLFEPSDTDERIDLSNKFSAISKLSISPTTSKSLLVHRISEEDCEKIKSYGCDVILRFGFNILKREILKCAEHGIWSFHHADNDVNRGGPPGFWEWLRNEPCSGTVLQVLNDNLDAGDVINKATYPTFHHSWNANRRRMYEQSKFLLFDSLSNLLKNNKPEFIDSKLIYDEVLFRAPGIIETSAAFFKWAQRASKPFFEKIFYSDQWGVLLGDFNPKNIELRKFSAFFPPKNRFWAHPFLIKKGEAHYVFVEEHVLDKRKGHITCLEIFENKIVSAKKVLEKSYSLSYPFLFEFNGDLFMCPETGGTNQIELYKCKNFPKDWEFFKVLIPNVDACGTSIHQHEGKSWLFTNIARNPFKGHDYELHIFWSDDPLSDQWIAHENNPVIQDSRSARNAGGLQTINGKLVRISQGSGFRHGSHFNLNEIVALTENRYEEKRMQSVHPNWERNLLGTHHLNIDDGTTVIDAERRTFRFF